MQKLKFSPMIWIVEPDASCANVLADSLRQHGAEAWIFGSIATALSALSQGKRPEVVIMAPFQGPVTELEFIEHLSAYCPKITTISTPRPQDASQPRPGVHILASPLDGQTLLRFIRLVSQPELDSYFRLGMESSPKAEKAPLVADLMVTS